MQQEVGKRVRDNRDHWPTCRENSKLALKQLYHNAGAEIYRNLFVCVYNNTGAILVALNTPTNQRAASRYEVVDVPVIGLLDQINVPAPKVGVATETQTKKPRASPRCQQYGKEAYSNDAKSATPQQVY